MKKKPSTPTPKQPAFDPAKINAESSPITADLLEAITTSKLSRYQIAKQSGISESVLSRFVSGQTSLSLENLDRIATVLGLRLKRIRTRKPKADE